MADHEEAERLPQSGLPVKSFRRTWSRTNRLDGQQVEFGGRDRKFLRGNGEASGKQVDWGEKQELVGGRSVFLCGLSGRIAVETGGAASGIRFNSAEKEASRKSVERLN